MRLTKEMQQYLIAKGNQIFDGTLKLNKVEATKSTGILKFCFAGGVIVTMPFVTVNRLFGMKDVLGTELRQSPPRHENIKTICYGQETRWESRDQAKEYYLALISASEGAERDRYTNVYVKLTRGMKVCTDDDLC